jgi:hypothetical protein
MNLQPSSPGRYASSPEREARLAELRHSGVRDHWTPFGETAVMLYYIILGALLVGAIVLLVVMKKKGG